MSSPGRYRGQFRPEFSRLHRDRDLFWVVPFPVRYVVAVTGERFAGKSSALAYLSEKKGFEVYSLATDLRRIALRRGLPLEPRSKLQDLGDLVRAENCDAAHLARLTLRRIHRDHLSHRPTAEAGRRIAVGGFKRPEEVELFENLSRFVQLYVSAGRSLRLNRATRTGMLRAEVDAITRGSSEDEKDFTEHIDKRDLHGAPDPWTGDYGQLVQAVVERPSAHELVNQGSLVDLHVALDSLVSELDDRFRTAGD